MTESIAKGSWVEIHSLVLTVGERAPQIPDDTRKVPLEMKVRGFLLRDARLGEDVEIRTLSGRRLGGTLSAVNPGYKHGFGAPIPALSTIAEEVRVMLSPGAERP